MMLFLIKCNILITFFDQITANIVIPKCAAWNPYGETIAGNGDGSSGAGETELNNPHGFGVSMNDLIYIADRDNNRITRYFKGDRQSGGRIGDGYGTGAFQVIEPTSVYIASNGLVYIGDSGNARVEKWNFISPTSSITIAGQQGEVSNTNDTFGGDLLGIYLNGNGSLYVSDTGNNRIMYFERNKIEGTEIAGTGQRGPASNQFDEPYFFYLDSNQTLYIADRKNRRIQKWTQNAIEGITIADSSPPLSLKDPRALTIDNNGIMYIVDYELEEIIKWNPVVKEASCILGCSRIPGSQADQLHHPLFIQFDSDGNLLVSDSGNHRVQLYHLFIDQNCLRANETCRPPKIMIIPEHQVLINAPEITRDKSIEFSLSININCTFVSYINRQWNILICENLGQPCVSNDDLISALPTATTSDLYIPPFLLQPGNYRIVCNVTIYPNELSSLATSYIKILPSIMEIYFVSSRTIAITINRNETLKLEPVKYSVDKDGNSFEDVSVSYHCRLYPNVDYALDSDGKLVRIGDETIFDPSYSSCLDINDFIYNDNTTEYSLTVHPNKLRADQIYEFQLILTNGISGRILVDVIDSMPSFSVGIKCVLNHCPIIEEFYRINADRDHIFHSFCLNNCSIKDFNIQWLIFNGEKTSTNDLITWSSIFDEYSNENLTIKKHLLLNREYLLLKVFYRSSILNGFGFLQFRINSPPMNGNCLISPLIGYTLTLFQIECYSWFDSDGIEDYSLFISSSSINLGTFISSEFQVYLPMGDADKDFQLELFIEISDRYQANRKFVFPSTVKVIPDKDVSMNSTIFMQSNFIQISEMIISISSVLNYLNIQDIQQLLNEDPTINISSLYISPLDAKRFSNSLTMKKLSFTEYMSNIKSRSILREKLFSSYDKNYPPTIHSILLQSSTLNKLTFHQNEFSRSSLLKLSNKCHELSKLLNSISSDLSKEQIEQSINHLTQCAVNALMGINGILLERSLILNEDDYKEFLSMQETFLSDQKQLANIIEKEYTDTINLLTNALDIHLNLHEQIEIKNPKISMIFSKFINQSNLFSHHKIITPLPLYGFNDVYIKFSNSFTISIDDHKNSSLDFLIPRDINMKIPEFIEENLLEKNQYLEYNYHYLKLNETQSNLSFSFHLEFLSNNKNLSYFIIYKFNSFPKFYSNENFTDGFTLFCSNDSIKNHQLFINNISSSIQEFIVIGIRQLNENEMYDLCILKKELIRINIYPMKFTSNYQYRYYLSACFYRDNNKNWQTDGLIVGPNTNLSQTHCITRDV